jgi:hypothetical protein
MRRWPATSSITSGPHQQGAKRQQRRQIHAGPGCQPQRQAGQRVEHPGRQFLPASRARVTRAAHHVPDRLLDHLMNVDDTSSPRMPRIKDLSLLGALDPVGVRSLGCTITTALQRALGGSTPAERIAELAPKIPTREAVQAAYDPSKEPIRSQNTRYRWLPTNARVT